MKIISIIFCLCLVATACTSVPGADSKNTLAFQMQPALPHAITNNAAVSITTSNGVYLASFNGLLAGKQWHDTAAHTYVLPPDATSWKQLPDVPGGDGRLASVAAAAGSFAYLFGGYTVAEDHTEVSLPLVHRFDPLTNRFTRLADMPVPVDDAIALVYQQRYIYLISGWHDTANVNLVQRYDTKEDRWIQATAYPGAPVFGHAGGIVDNQIVVCGGVKIKTHASEPREFVMNNDCYAGTIRADNARRIDWRTINAMPGAARYRMAAAGSARLKGVVFLGGSNNPYNYNGTGYNGQPSEPVATAWQFNLLHNTWLKIGDLQTPTMDHRGLLVDDKHMVTIGGMERGQKVLAVVIAYELP